MLPKAFPVVSHTHTFVTGHLFEFSPLPLSLSFSRWLFIVRNPSLQVDFSDLFKEVWLSVSDTFSISRGSLEWYYSLSLSLMFVSSWSLFPVPRQLRLKASSWLKLLLFLVINQINCKSPLLICAAWQNSSHF